MKNGYQLCRLGIPMSWYRPTVKLVKRSLLVTRAYELPDCLGFSPAGSNVNRNIVLLCSEKLLT